MRLDVFLVSSGLCRSRATAAEAVRSSNVTVNGAVVQKPSYEVLGDEDIRVAETMEKYVSRGGYKLEAALNAFGTDVTGLACADIGASTGGFTDCLLKRGAASVLAIDSGRDQLSGELRADHRVTSLEETNIREFFPEEGRKFGFVCVDVSFISLKYVFPAIARMLEDNGAAVCLIKPQFEAGRENIGKNGIVRDRKVHRRVLREVTEAAEGHGLGATGLIPSPIKGGDGNAEYLCRFCRGRGTVTEKDIFEAVAAALPAAGGKTAG